MQEIITKTPIETEDLGLKLARDLKTGDIVVLTGVLGAGKTVFSRGIAKGLNIKSRVISPTFVLVRKHRGKLNGLKINLYHIDLYRLENANDIASLGLEDIFEDTNGIFLIEWGKKDENLHASWEIEIETVGENKRRIKINHE